jgi:TolA-binding protein
VDDAKAMYLRAAEQTKARNYRGAIQTFETLLQTYTNVNAIRPEALYWLGECYSKVGDPATAERVWRQLNSEYPDSNWGKYARGRLFPGNGVLLPPRPDCEVSDYPTNSLPEAEASLLGVADAHFAKKDYSPAAAAYDSFMLKCLKSKACAYAMVRQGRSLQFVGRRSEALAIYKKVLDFYPDSISNAAPAKLYMAQCNYLDGNVKEATTVIARLRADKDYGKHEATACATFLLAHMQAEVGKTEEAIATLQTIASPFPAYAALAQLRQAEVYENAGKKVEAIAAYRAALKEYPGTREAGLAHRALDRIQRSSPGGAQLAL